MKEYTDTFRVVRSKETGEFSVEFKVITTVPAIPGKVVTWESLYREWSYSPGDEPKKTDQYEIGFRILMYISIYRRHKKVREASCLEAKACAIKYLESKKPEVCEEWVEVEC